MINKRLLIKNLLAHHDENSFYDRKERLNLGDRQAKGRFLKHICALSNANPKNRSYIVVGVDDRNSKIIGVDFFDDSRLQNLVNAYLENAPKVQYENVAFPELPRHKVIGLVTIYPSDKLTFFKKNIWRYVQNSIFLRRGSTSIPVEALELQNTNQKIVEDIEKQSLNNIKHTLDAVIHFIKKHDEIHTTDYHVYNEQHVLCWAGEKKQVGNKTFYTRVDIELVNEQVRLFYSDMDEVKIIINKDSFIITEYVPLGIHRDIEFYPLEKTVFHFKDNGRYNIVSEMLFKPPRYRKSTIQTLYEQNNRILKKISNNESLTPLEESQLKELPNIYLICYFNGIEEALESLEKSKIVLKNLPEKNPYIKFKEVRRIIRKVKY